MNESSFKATGEIVALRVENGRKEVQKVGRVECASIEEANALYDDLEQQGFDYISVLSNTPTHGSHQVSWGHYVAVTESASDYEMRMLSRIYEEREQEAAREFTAACEGEGRQVAARILAAAAGLEGRDAEVFCFGFCGWSAKLVNPRAEGREPQFRAGRLAWGSKEGQRLWRIESVKARSVIPPVSPKPFIYPGS